MVFKFLAFKPWLFTMVFLQGCLAACVLDEVVTHRGTIYQPRKETISVFLISCREKQVSGYSNGTKKLELQYKVTATLLFRPRTAVSQTV